MKRITSPRNASLPLSGTLLSAVLFSAVCPTVRLAPPAEIVTGVAKEPRAEDAYFSVLGDYRNYYSGYEPLCFKSITPGSQEHYGLRIEFDSNQPGFRGVEYAEEADAFQTLTDQSLFISFDGRSSVGQEKSYQTEPHQPWPALPPGPERLNYRDQRVLITAGQATSGATSSGPTPAVQDFRTAADGKLLVYNPGKNGDWLELRFHCDREQTADLFGRLVCDNNRGIYRVYLDGAEIGSADLYFFRDRPVEFKWGRRTLSAGPHTLRFECSGKNVVSLGYSLGFDQLLARIPVYLRAEDSDLRSLQQP